MKVIGITGTIACGKEFVKDIIVKSLDCYYVSLSGAIFGQMEKKKGTFDRKMMMQMGNELRQKYGTHVIAKVSTEFMPREKPFMIVDGIRNPGEAEWLKKAYKGNFFLLAVDAPQQVRFERMMKRAKPIDPKTFEEFVQQDERDQGKGEPEYGQQVRRCMDMADLTIENDGDEAKLKAAMQEFFRRVQ